MHPNVFLKTFWRMDLKPQVFVAMSFATQYKSRYETIIAPAIESIKINNTPLKAYRVDTSKSGDSILTDIMEGIAHSQMVIADVSTFGKDSATKQPYRNGNVMYEVGIALACRQPNEVLLVRDDTDNFLFDVSTIPHMTIDFSQENSARQRLQEELMARIQERQYVNDARVQLAIAGLSAEELTALKQVAEYAPGTVWGRKDTGSVDFFAMASTPRLLDKGLIQLAGIFLEGHPAYRLTPLGIVVAKLVQSGLPEFKAQKPVEAVTEASPPEAGGA
ncbi:MAG: hypothetical protein PH343_06530 [Nitrospira sp.]|nr:hypothetical protein [Nitrospira sp.]